MEEPVPPNPPVAASRAAPLSGLRQLTGASREAYGTVGDGAKRSRA
ncbi:MAG: hypothetical protein LBD24_06260 [Spirochaetaceae bacterium]|nr:hypothetical protein [Spirochaetaceae bacterium]